MPEASLAQLVLDGAQQVVGVFGDVEVRIARDAGVLALNDVHPREQAVDMRRHQLFERHQMPVERHQARQARGDPNKCEALLAGLGVADDQAEVEREARDIRKRQPGPDGQRGQRRRDLVVVELIGLGAQRLVEIRDVRDEDAPGGQSGAHVLGPDAHLFVDELPDAGADRRDDRIARHRVRRRRPPTGRGGLLHRCDPHHEELIEDAGADRQEPGALKQRSGRILGLGEHPREEVQPAQLAVGVERGILQVDGRAGDVGGVEHRP